MSRPPKPILPQTEPQIEQVPLDEDTVKHLARCLDIEKDPARIKKMTVEVELALTAAKESDKRPSIASQIVFLESLQDSALCLLKGFRDLKKDYYTRVSLYAPLLFLRKIEDSRKIEDTVTEFESDFLAVKGVYEKIRYSLKKIRSQSKTRGKPKKYAIGTAMALLFSIFEFYNRNDKRKKHRLAEFIDLALEAGKISHPAPDQTRFYRQLKPFLKPFLS